MTEIKFTDTRSKVDVNSNMSLLEDVLHMLVLEEGFDLGVLLRQFVKETLDFLCYFSRLFRHLLNCELKRNLNRIKILSSSRQSVP